MIHEALPNLYCLTTDDDEAFVAPAFVAVRPEGGNFIFGSGEGHAAHFDEIDRLGPVAAVFIGDRHHGKTYSPAASHFGAPLCCSKEEAKVVGKKGVAVDRIIDFERHWLHEDLEILPTPGHTVGALSYLWTSGSHRVLFIGDTVVPVDGEWRVSVNRKNRSTMLDTMATIGSMDFDYIAAGSGAATGPKVIELSAKAKTAMIDQVALALTGS